MGFVIYAPATKVAVVRMTIQGLTPDFIRNALGVSPSRQSFNRWMELYRETRCVIRDPAEYEKQGRPALLTAEECLFMVNLLKDEPSLFLDEIRERLYDAQGTMLSVETVHNTLVKRLAITLKKPDTINSRKCLMAKYIYIEKIRPLPAEYFVFCGEFCLADSVRSSKDAYGFFITACFLLLTTDLTRQMKLLYVTENCLGILLARLVEHDPPVWLRGKILSGSVFFLPFR
jgi:transposase